MKEKKNQSKRWFRLDNAAKLYPAIDTSDWGSVFRVTAVLKQDVDPDILQEAFARTITRFPSFAVQLKRGLFWYYLEQNPNPVPQVKEDIASLCLRFKKGENNDYCLRVYYRGKRIAVEFFHLLTDGSGCIIFTKTLVGEYLKLAGIVEHISYDEDVLDITQAPKESELEDAYEKYAKSTGPLKRNTGKAYRIRGTKAPKYMLNVIGGTIPTDILSQKAKEYDATITEYLVSMVIDLLQDFQEVENPIRQRNILVSVPVNMRRFYNTNTLRNFSLFVNVGINPRYGHWSFEEVVHQVKYSLRLELSDKYLNAQMSKNVAPQKNKLMRLTPLFIKDLSLQLVFRLIGDRQFSTTITNLGVLRVPKEMEEHIENIEFVLGPSPVNPFNCAVSSFKDHLKINFSSTMEETEFERLFFTRMIQEGIPVTIDTNRGNIEKSLLKR